VREVVAGLSCDNGILSVGDDPEQLLWTDTAELLALARSAKGRSRNGYLTVDRRIAVSEESGRSQSLVGWRRWTEK